MKTKQAKKSPAPCSFQQEVRRQLGFRPPHDASTAEVLEMLSAVQPALDAVESLKRVALSKGDGQVLAALALAGLGERVAHAVRELWFGEIPPTDERDPTLERQLRREILRRQVFADNAIPVLSGAHDEVMTAQADMLEMLKHGPRKTKGVHGGIDTLGLLIAHAEREFDRIRLHIDEPNGELEVRISNLPPLSFNTRKAWASVGADWLVDNTLDPFTQGSPLYRVSNAGRFCKKDAKRGPANGRLRKTHFRQGLREAILKRYTTVLRRA